LAPGYIDVCQKEASVADAMSGLWLPPVLWMLRLPNAQESGIKMINPTIATTITMTTIFGSLKLWLAT
jgi:hypothetical protein